jgi:hypothetical protein
MSDFKMYLNMYQFDTRLPGSGKELKIKPITTGQLKRMLMYETVSDMGKIENALDVLITECVLDKDFNVNDLYLQDRFFLLAELRKITRGNMYTFTAFCDNPLCNSQYVHTIDLSKLPMKPFKIGQVVEKREKKSEEKSVPIKVERKKKGMVEIVPEQPVVEENTNPWVVELNNGLKVELSMITRGMQSESFRIISTRQGAPMTDSQKRIESITMTTAFGIKAIITPDGDKNEALSIQDKIYFLDNITQPDMEKIQKWYDAVDFGIEFKFNVKCPHCGKEEMREVPLEDFFF